LAYDVTVIVSLELGVVVTEPRLDPGSALLTLTVTLVAGVVVVAVVVVLAAVPPAPPLVVLAVLVLAPEAPLDPAEIEPRLAKTWLNPATPETPILASTQNNGATFRVKPLSNGCRFGYKIARPRRRFTSANTSWPEFATETVGAGCRSRSSFANST
jgi:hypothetical protein